MSSVFTSATQYCLLGQYCENILFVLTEYSYFTLCEPSCNGGSPLQRGDKVMKTESDAFLFYSHLLQEGLTNKKVGCIIISFQLFDIGTRI